VIETFPPRATRIIEVHVRVDDTWQQQQAARVDGRRSRCVDARLFKRDDAFVLDNYVESFRGCGVHDARASNDEAAHATSSGGMPISASNAGHTCGS
jgi:hypothetical protein